MLKIYLVYCESSWRTYSEKKLVLKTLSIKKARRKLRTILEQPTPSAVYDVCYACYVECNTIADLVGVITGVTAPAELGLTHTNVFQGGVTNMV